MGRTGAAQLGKARRRSRASEKPLFPPLQPSGEQMPVGQPLFESLLLKLCNYLAIHCRSDAASPANPG